MSEDQVRGRIARKLKGKKVGEEEKQAIIDQIMDIKSQIP